MNTPGGAIAVPPRQEVMFEDGTALVLHRVNADEGPDLFLRRIEQPNGAWVKFNLGRLIPALNRELPIAQTRDVPGIVFFRIKHKFASAGAFLEAVHEVSQ